MSNKTKSKTEKEAPAEATAKPEPPKRNWAKGEYAGRNVFTAKGKGIIASQDKAAGRFLVTIGDEDHDMSEKSVRFKALDDKHRENYTTDKRIKTASGSPSVHCGDDVASAMLGLTHDELAPLAKENGIDFTRWSHLNPGMQRMNLGNVLRRMHKAHVESPADKPAVTFYGLSADAAAKKRSDEADAEAKKAAKIAADKAAAKPAKPAKKDKADKKAA